MRCSFSAPAPTSSLSLGSATAPATGGFNFGAAPAPTSSAATGHNQLPYFGFEILYLFRVQTFVTQTDIILQYFAFQDLIFLPEEIKGVRKVSAPALSSSVPIPTVKFLF